MADPPGDMSGPPEPAEAPRAGADAPTDTAPTFRHPIGGSPSGGELPPRPGERLGDFELLHELGKGAFGRVFLARQVSLGRQVALKVTGIGGNEARTLASLEHDHIVRVFSETVDPERNRRLLCMQYVAGTTLARVIQALNRRPAAEWSGAAIVAAIDALSAHPATLDPAALRDREFLAGCDHVEAVCWIGARLAEALAYAHGQGVLHRDIKPANILLNQYGRPLLADFNLAFDPEKGQSAGEVFGGTLAYMAPEHLAAFNPEDPAGREVVDRRSDIWSLGVVLFELLTGRLPFPWKARNLPRGPLLRELGAERRAGPPAPPGAPPVLQRVLGRCLDPDPARRYQTAAELARALDGCRELRRVAREMPATDPVVRATLRWPFAGGLFLMVVPHFLASAVNISYNAVRIVGDLTPVQRSAFRQLALGYNLAVYTLCLGLLAWLLVPIFRAVRRLEGSRPLDSPAVDAVRLQALRLPLRTVGLSALGWLPGALFFPLGLHWLAGPVGPEVFVHFLISNTLAGLIALTYSVLAVQFWVLRVVYPRLWSDGQDMREKARAELGQLGGHWRLFQFLAGLIPLAGAVLMVGVGPDQFHEGDYQSFRVLVTVLIALGMAGFGVALRASGRLGQTLTALLGGERPGAFKSY